MYKGNILPDKKFSKFCIKWFEPDPSTNQKVVKPIKICKLKRMTKAIGTKSKIQSEITCQSYILVEK